jgi:predicted peptidase
MNSRSCHLIWVFLILFGCKVDYTPPIGGSSLLPVPFGSSECPFGYYEYLPQGYRRASAQKYPLIISLHGSGQRGKSKKDPQALDKLLQTGLPNLIANKRFSPPEPMVVIALQTEFGFDANNLHRSIKWLIKTYQIDPQRVYMTGFSMGAFAIFRYLGTYGTKSLVAAAVPICGGGDLNKVNKMKETPIWAFHGQTDQVVDPKSSIEIIEAIIQEKPSQYPKLTLYEHTGHESWDITYTGLGKGLENPDYDALDTDIFTWMLQHRHDQ